MEKIQGRFNKAQRDFFNARAGAYSMVTDREGTGDRSVTLDTREKEIVYHCIEELAIPRQSKESRGHDGFPFRIFRPGNLSRPEKLKLVFPKPEGNELRLYFRDQTFGPEPGDVWFVYQDAGESSQLVVGHLTRDQWVRLERHWSDRKPPKAWLVIAAGENRQFAGNEGYDDDPSRYYSWDSKVPNHKLPSNGDYIVLRDEKGYCLGASVIERIEEGKAMKKSYVCPQCLHATFKERKNTSPRYRCYECKSEFEDPKQSDELEVVTYRSEHAGAWLPLDGYMDPSDLRNAQIQPETQLSIRELDWARFSKLLDRYELWSYARLLEAEKDQADGHSVATVRARKGQGVFRDRLIKRYGNVCALTGPQPNEVLEAAHLYSYAEVGKHDGYGGLLLRRDVHKLFDHGFLAIRQDGTIDVLPLLMEHETYAALHGTRIRVKIADKTWSWLQKHWEFHRQD